MEYDYLSGDLNIKGSNIMQTLGDIIPCHIISMTGDKQSQPKALCVESLQNPAVKREYRNGK